MSAPEQQIVNQENKISDKELNFRALESKYQKQLEQVKSELEQARRIAEEAMNKKQIVEDEDDEPYVDHKKLNRTLEKFGEKTKQQTQTEIQRAVQTALSEEKKQSWVKNNPDFYDILQKHAQEFAEKDPELAESILDMPEGFERQKLVYKNIKALGIDKPASKQSSIQDKVNANQRSPYYQPSGIGNSPYSNGGDFSEGGQKQAYAKMQELKSKLRI